MFFDVAQWVASYESSGKAETVVTRPRQIGCWTKTSIQDGAEILFGDKSGLLPFTAPKLPQDLNRGYPADYIKKDETEASPVDTVVQAAQQANTDWSQVHVCTYRNNLNKILLTPLSPDKEWGINACLRGNTLFLDITKAGYDDSNSGPEVLSYYGYKFESICTGQQKVDSTSEFAAVLQYKLGRHEVVMAAEMDAVADAGEGPLDGPPYLELKTYRIPGHRGAMATMYRDKHPRWWVQSFLAGVSTLVLGGRDTKGDLLKVQHVPVQLLPGLSASAGNAWDPGLLLGFGDELLAWMADEARQHPGQQVYFSHSIPERKVFREVLEGDLPARLQQLLPQQ